MPPYAMDLRKPIGNSSMLDSASATVSPETTRSGRRWRWSARIAPALEWPAASSSRNRFTTNRA